MYRRRKYAAKVIVQQTERDFLCSRKEIEKNYKFSSSENFVDLFCVILTYEFQENINKSSAIKK